MAIAISASLLTAYYDAQEGVGASTTSSSTSSSSSKAAPTPPWESTSTAPKQSALVSSALNGGQFFSASNTAKLTAPSGADSADYQSLFSLYQGVNALEGLATAAGASNVGATQAAAYAAAFSSGMTQLSTYLSKTSFSSLQVSEGTLTASSESTVGAPVETDTYTTGTIYSGASDGVAPAFQGDVSFTVNLTSPSGSVKSVNFDLSQMGATPRTMANVVTYLNSQLKAAGATTRFQTVATAATPVTTKVDGKTVTLSTPPENYALEIVGTDTENPTFSATSTTPAVYVTTASGPAAQAATALTTAVTGDQSQQLLKFNTSSASSTPTTTTTLQSTVASALASATAPDGSVYVLANVDGTTADGQTINGTQDVALMKYDSAGNLDYTRTLGAADSATGYSLAVSADGSNVAVAGAVTGPLNGAEADQDISATSTNSFVADYDAAGDQQWSTSQNALAGNQATGVAFGGDGSVYVTGTSQGRIADSTTDGGSSAYLQGYSSTGSLQFSTQFGTGSVTPAGIAVSGSTVYVAGTENGDAVVRQFDLQSSGTATPGAVENLGALDGGAVAGVGVNTDGSVVVAGSTSNGSLSVGTVTNAYQSGEEGFVASLDPSLDASPSNTLSYVNTGGNFTASAMTVSGGQAYLAGQVATTAPTGSGYTGTSSGYVAAVDTTSGGVTWSQSFQGTEDVEAPTSVAVSATGSSVLDQLGLPTTINYAKSTLITSNTSVAAGDSFYVQSGSSTPQKITIQPTDTLRTLATEIERASGYTATATTVTVDGETQIKITPSNSTTAVKLLAGPSGANALTGLGLNAGEISSDVGETSTSSHKVPVALGLNLSGSLNLNTASSIKAASTALALAGAKIENAYQSLANPTTSTSTSTNAASSAQSAATSARIANYQQALEWLNNNEGTTSSTSSLLL